MILDKNVFILILLIKLGFFFPNQIDNNYINTNQFSIQNATYIIQNRDGSLSLDFKDIPLFKNKFNVSRNIIEISQEYDDYFSISNIVIHKSQNYKVYLSTNSNNNLIISTRSFFQNHDSSLWKIIPKINEDNQLIYFVQNKQTKRFMELNTNIDENKPFMSNFTDNSKISKYNEFKFIELYKEVNEQNSHSSILENEPIDVLIKYIDLSDPDLDREGINQIPKDNDNNELKYSVRSILKYLPWIRKIFILMPNEEVKFFKPQNEIKDKIVYVKDKDIIGFDSANNCVFSYNLYKMKQYGLSENFILMDDDYFIGQTINKNEFFYEEKGEIFPALVTADYYEIDKRKLQNNLQTNLKKRKSSDAHSAQGFRVRQTRALLFLYDIFGNDDIRYSKKLIEPSFTHNAIPVKCSDIKELHDLVLDKYKYGKDMLFSKERSTYDLQFQTLYMAYVKNKYDRKVSKIHSEFFDLAYAGKIIRKKDEKIKLFVINTSSGKYNYIFYKREKHILNQLFPEKTIYEKDFSFNYLMKIKKIKLEFLDFNLTQFRNQANSEIKKYYTNIFDDMTRKLEEIKHFKKNNKINMIKEIICINGIKKIILKSKEDERKIEFINFTLLFILVLLLIYLIFIQKDSDSEYEQIQ